ncbi:hypothetical protein E3N88_19355 [Mikania micrantha]|uniref:Mitochondrial import inner membrane translocase subunit TIM50 n=1 Tax=Mikania micrantha TaxID=192012 RepID=A0A5N6NPB5_9ASTR|nr:hypothetical protein E3N88_19355 [Mikania micrantha]
MEYDSSPAKRRKISHENPESNKDPNLNAIEGSTMDATEETGSQIRVIDTMPAQMLGSSGDDGHSHCRNKLLVLDVNGRNIKQVLDFLMRDTQHQLLFCWDEIWLLYRINLHCIGTCFNTIENNEKPLLLNELKKLWEKQDPNLPWDRGVFDESNTLILDDSPYKALLNLVSFFFFFFHCNFHSGIYEKIVPNFCSLDLLLGGSPTLRVGIIGAFIESSLPTAMPPCKDSSSTDDLNLSMSDQLAQPLATAAATSTTSNQTASQLADLIQPTLRVVFKRPYCDVFLQFCFGKFNVGIWTSTTKYNMECVLDFLMRDTQHKLLFCWDLSHCTDTGFSTVENRCKRILLKEIRKLWEKKDSNLPWELGEYDESNTLLVENAPCKALLNPPNTAIFPYPYRYWNREDNSLEFKKSSSNLTGTWMEVAPRALDFLQALFCTALHVGSYSAVNGSVTCSRKSGIQKFKFDRRRYMCEKFSFFSKCGNLKVTRYDMDGSGWLGSIQDHLNKFLSLKSKADQHEDTLKEVENMLEKCDYEKHVAETETDELKMKMQLGRVTRNDGAE